MSELALPKGGEPRATGLGAAARHVRYVLRENAVTGFAFALFVVIVFGAAFGPYLVPHHPLASDTAAAL
jgi:peptide/nickel transport system permease protein